VHDKRLSRRVPSDGARDNSHTARGAADHLNNPTVSTFVITAIVAAPRHPGRFEIDVNGGAFASLSLEAIERLRISIGSDITDRVETVLAEAARLATYDRALNMLAFRARSTSELSRALIRKGSDPEHVAHAIARLVEQGFVDDASFARAFTRAKVVGASHSKRRVQQELQRRGVARDVASGAIGEVFEDEAIDELALIEAAARRKLSTLSALEPAVRRRRLYGFLMRRGFDASDIQRVMNALGNPVQATDGE
jgi:regulatory protein